MGRASFCLIGSTRPCPCPKVDLPISICDDVVGGAVGGCSAGAVGGGGGGEDDAGRGELRGGGGTAPGQARLQGGGQGGEQEQVEQEELHAEEWEEVTILLNYKAPSESPGGLLSVMDGLFYSENIIQNTNSVHNTRVENMKVSHQF